MEPERPQMTIWRRVACWMSKTSRAQAHGNAVHPHLHTQQLTRIESHAQKYIILITFYGNSSFVNAPHCYAIRTLPRLFLFFFLKLCDGSCFVFSPSAAWTLCGLARRSVRVVEQFWCFYPLKGPNNAFVFLGQACEVRICENWGLEV